MAFLDLYKLDGRRPFETSRFPGWTLRLRYDAMSGELLLGATRKSDGKRLQYAELCGTSVTEYNEAARRLSDRLGAEFLDLVPVDAH